MAVARWQCSDLQMDSAPADGQRTCLCTAHLLMHSTPAGGQRAPHYPSLNVILLSGIGKFNQVTVQTVHEVDERKLQHVQVMPRAAE